MNVAGMAWRHLKRQPARTLLTLIGITITCAACFAIVAAVQGFERTIVGGLEEPTADFMVGPKNAFTLFGGSVPENIAARIGALSGIESATGVLLNVMTADGKQNLAVSARPSGSFSSMQIQKLNGRLPNSDDVNPIVLGDGIAKAWSKGIGDTIELEYIPFRIIGVAEFSSYMNRNIAMIPLKDAQSLLRREGSVTYIEVRLKRPLNSEMLRDVRARLSDVASPHEVFDTTEFVKSVKLIAIVRSIARTITLIMLLVTLMIVANTMLMSVNERTYEFGVLTALGWRQGRIMGLVIFESLLLTATGAILGLALGIATMTAISQFADQAYLRPSLDPLLIGGTLAAVIGLGLLGALYPARKAVQMNAVEALRKA